MAQRATPYEYFLPEEGGNPIPVTTYTTYHPTSKLPAHEQPTTTQYVELLSAQAIPQTISQPIRQITSGQTDPNLLLFGFGVIGLLGLFGLLAYLGSKK